jgi:hypothetical protein
MERISAKFGYLLIDHRHSLIPPKVVLITKSVDCPDFISLAKGEFGSRLVIRIQMGILDPVLGFQADPFDIVFLCHWVLYRPHGNMNGIAVHLINRDMLLSGSLCRTRLDLVHFFTTAHNRNTCVPNHGDDIAAMLADIEFLFHKLPPSKESVSFSRSIMHQKQGILPEKEVEKWSKATNTKRDSSHTHWLLF